MRILVVSQYFWPENFRLNDLVSELSARGHEVTVLTGTPNYPDGRTFPAYRASPSDFAQYLGARIIRVPLIPRGSRKLTLALNYLSFAVSACLFGAFRLRGQRFDAILALSASPVTACLPANLLRWTKHAPLVIWVIDLWPESLSAVGVVRSERVLGWVRGLVRFIYTRADRVLGQSRSFLPKLKALVGPQGRVDYFPSWAEPLPALEDSAPAPELAHLRDRFVVMFTGNIGEAQDFPTLLAAAELLRDQPAVHWVIVGDGRAAEWVRAEIARRDLGGLMTMAGRFPLERMPSFFRCADALLVSLRADPIFAMTIPGKVQSYLSAGRPVLACLDGEGARVIADAGAGLCCAAGDAAGLADNIRRLAALPAEERAAMGRAGRMLSATEFDRDRLVTQLEGWLAAPTGG